MMSALARTDPASKSQSHSSTSTELPIRDPPGFVPTRLSLQPSPALHSPALLQSSLSLSASLLDLTTDPNYKAWSGRFGGVRDRDQRPPRADLSWRPPRGPRALPRTAEKQTLALKPCQLMTAHNLGSACPERALGPFSPFARNHFPLQEKLSLKKV